MLENAQKRAVIYQWLSWAYCTEPDADFIAGLVDPDMAGVWAGMPVDTSEAQGEDGEGLGEPPGRLNDYYGECVRD